MNKNILSITLAALLSFGSMPVLAKDKTEIKTTVDPEPYKTTSELESALSDYSNMDSLTFDAYGGESKGTIVIPGLHQTATLGWSDNPANCTYMTPQGITADDSHIYISAYCHEHQHKSVIYQLDKESGKLEQTLVLDGMPHAGSIAYDPDHNVIWVAAHTSHHATANAISMADIDSYEEGKVLPWMSVQELEDLPRDSYLTWDDGKLYAGTFTKEGDMEVHSYDIDGKGNLIHREKKVKPKSTDKIGANAQGIAIADGNIITSSSDGPSDNSVLAVFPKSDKDLIDSTASKTVTLPPRSEQVWKSGNTLYILFESGSKAYRDEGLVVNRVLSMDLDKLLNS